MIDETPANIDKVIKKLAALKINVECKLDWMLTAQFEEVYEKLCSPQKLLMLTEKTVSKPDIIAFHKKLLKLKVGRADAAQKVNRINRQIEKGRRAEVDAPDGSKAMNNIKASLADAKRALKDKQLELQSIKGKIAKKTSSQRAKIQKMARNLSHSFRMSLVSLHHYGEIEAVTSGDLANWGLKIYIKNTLSAEDQMLTRQGPSEHDRLMAMAAFMMALHEWSR